MMIKNLSHALLLFSIGLSLIMISCADNSTKSDTMINIRIRNNSSLDIENFWLGAGSGTINTAYKAIPSGDTTPYKQIEPHLSNYRKVDIVADGQRYLDTIYFEDYIGENELTPGRSYTFAYDIVDGEAQLNLIEED